MIPTCGPYSTYLLCPISTKQDLLILLNDRTTLYSTNDLILPPVATTKLPSPPDELVPNQCRYDPNTDTVLLLHLLPT